VVGSPPLFCVVIPTRNRVGLVARAIESVRAQTCSDHELVIVDDGSTDGTQELLRTIQGPRCRVIRNERGTGVSAARNTGVAAASSELITFLDDDDELRPHALQRLRERYAAYSRLDFLWGGRLVHEKDGDGQTIATREDDWHHVPCPIAGAGFLPYALRIATNAAFTLRRSLCQQLGGFDVAFRLSEDRDLFVTLAEGGYLGAAVDATIIDVYERASSLSRSTGVQSAPDFDLRVLEKHRSYLQRPENRGFENAYLAAIFASFLQGGNRRGAMHILAELRRRGALEFSLLRKYARHAPEFRALKSLLRYNRLRRLLSRTRRPDPAAH